MYKGKPYTMAMSCKYTRCTLARQRDGGERPAA